MKRSREHSRLFTFLLVFILVPLSCKDVINKVNNITVEELLEDTTFRSVAESSRYLSSPILENITSMRHDNVIELANKLDKIIDRLKNNKSGFSINKLDNNIEFDRLVKMMGFKDSKSYRKRYEKFVGSFSRFTAKYPQFKNIKRGGEEALLIKKALSTYFRRNKKADIKTSLYNFGNSMMSCENEEGLSSCIGEATESFWENTAYCAVGGGILGGVIGVASCQAVNIYFYEDEKQDCLEEHC